MYRKKKLAKLGKAKPTRIWWEVKNTEFGHQRDFPVVYVRGTESAPYNSNSHILPNLNWFEWTWQSIPENEIIMWIREDKRAAAAEERQRREKQEKLRKEEEERRRQEQEEAAAANEEKQRQEAEKERNIPRIADELTAEVNAILKMNKDQIQEFFGFSRGQLSDEAKRKLQEAGKKMVRKFHPDKASNILGSAVAADFFKKLNTKLAILAFPNEKDVLIGTGRKSYKKCRKCGLLKS